MLTIEREWIEERITLGELFNNLGYPESSPPTDNDGDTCIDVRDWDIKVLSDAGFHPIEAIRWTKPERTVEVYHGHHSPGIIPEDDIQSLRCSPEHLLMTDKGWMKAGDLDPGDLICSRPIYPCVEMGFRKVVSPVAQVEGLERLCDLQVGDVHRYYTDGLLSHNSHWLVQLGCNALRSGVDVLHYTFELSEAAVGRRYDSNLCEIDSNDVIENKEGIIARYQQMKLGRLMIKEFPTNTASIYTLRSHIERLDLKGFRPGLIIIDYADIMRSTRQYDSLRHELKLIYEELRGFAGEKLLPIWTASQSNKDGATSDVVDLGNMSEAYGKAMVADVVLSISRKSHEKSKGWGRLFIAKNRAGRDGIVYPIKIDTARSKFEIVGGPGDLQEAKQDDERLTKKALRQKWEELRRDPVLRKPDDDDGSDEP